jgi:hypothetical protein
MLEMELTYNVAAGAVAVLAAAAYVIHRMFARPTYGLDAGAVSQSWLTEHNAGKGERF